MHDGRAKLYVTWKALQFRKAHAALFRDGSYLPAGVVGEHASHVCTYARRLEHESVLIVIPRLYARLLGESEELPLGAGVWADTAIELPRRFGAATLHNILDGCVVEATARDGAQFVPLSAVLANFPVALLAASSR
jgi:(1->4)-alpha-D-glucan 1-alpha-D-glucosylmutase